MSVWRHLSVTRHSGYQRGLVDRVLNVKSLSGEPSPTGETAFKILQCTPVNFQFPWFLQVFGNFCPFLL